MVTLGVYTMHVCESEKAHCGPSATGMGKHGMKYTTPEWFKHKACRVLLCAYTLVQGGSSTSNLIELSQPT